MPSLRRIRIENNVQGARGFEEIAGCVSVALSATYGKGVTSVSYKITVLVENSAPIGSGLETEHGLSFFVETPESHFIFDCGHTGVALRNAVRMSIDLSTVQFVVLSHSHYDHVGGFPSLLECVKPKEVYVGMDFWQEKFSWNKETVLVSRSSTFVIALTRFCPIRFARAASLKFLEKGKHHEENHCPASGFLPILP